MILRSLVIVLSTLFTMSCISFPYFHVEPTTEEETLVIGRVLLSCENTQAGSLPYGEYIHNVVVVFEDLDTGRYIEEKTAYRGIFYIHNPKGHRLRLIELSYEQIGSQPDSLSKEALERSMEEWATAAVQLTWPKVFVIQRNKVNNLGRFIWEADMLSDMHEVEINREYEETVEAFIGLYPESLWLQREWVEIEGVE
jgi:hypothetical protein